MKLKMLREDRNLSRSKLARLSSISVKTIEAYEQGVRNINTAKIEILCKLCETLECTISDILEDERLIEKYKKVS